MNFRFFNEKYQRVPRVLREQILCSMIRINFGTPWQGDMELLQSFFPSEYHAYLSFGGLNDLIDQLSPFTSEPTNHSPLEEEFECSRTILEGEKTFLHGDDAVTASLPDITQKSILPYESTRTMRVC